MSEEYREGNEDDLLPEQKEKSVKDENEIETAFLIVTFKDGRIEAATEIPHIKMTRKSNLKDVRDATRVVYDDISLMMTTKATAGQIQQMLMQSANHIMNQQESQRLKNVISDPKGHFLRKKK